MSASLIAFNYILVPVDFSPASHHGLSYAAALAEKFHARLRLLHVVEPPVLPEWGYAHIPQRAARLRHAAVERMPKLAGECGINPCLIESTDIRNGEAEDEICQAALDNHSDLIVLASHGLGGFQHALFGSTAERVVRRAPCSVLTVRDQVLRTPSPEGSGAGFRRIMVTTDFSEGSKTAFPTAVGLARKFEAMLTLVYVVPAHLPLEFSHMGIILQEQQLVDEAREHLPRFRHAQLDPHIHVETVVLNGAPAREICHMAADQSIDLIVMATHGHAGLKHLMLGSVAESVVRHAPCPVLIVRDTTDSKPKPMSPLP